MRGFQLRLCAASLSGALSVCQADALHAALKEDRAKLTDAEASANYATRQRESEVTQLRSSLHDSEGRTTRAEASVKELSSQLVDTERRLGEALNELSATSARLSEVRIENETMRVSIGNIENEGTWSCSCSFSGNLP
jgi:septal ring factor EnvC (AmiA/AmiB activator)